MTPRLEAPPNVPRLNRSNSAPQLSPHLLAVAVLLSLGISPSLAADPTTFLWQIGQPDNTNREFALAPNRYREFRDDGFYVVGQSETKRDWPYVHPGPSDSWAGGKQHTFTVLFGLKSAPTQGQCRLQFDLLDTQNAAPPKLKVQLNGHGFERSLPKGGGDASVNGDPTKGQEHKFELAIPAEFLRGGDNDLQITTLTGSWLLYDWIGFEAPTGLELAPVRTRTLVDAVQPVQALFEKDGRSFQPVRVSIRHFGEATEATVRVEGAEPVRAQLNARAHEIDVPVPAVAKETSLSVKVETDGQTLAGRTVTVKPVRKMTVYILPHSHTDIGYTEIQTAIEKKQMENLRKGIQYARRTADYPAGAQFKWNVEVLWAADLYLRRMSEEQRAEFLDAVKKGWVGLNGMYLNELTGLCRPEELVRLFRFATQLGEQCGVTIDSAMISDVPGYTWGTVTAMAHAGIKYFSTAPNYFDRIGDILVQWENKPFYWTSPSGQEKVLVWIPFKGYAMSHIYPKLTPAFVGEYQAQLEKMGYPYDIAYMRWSGHGDNAEPDPAICEFVKEWNPRYAWPKFVIASTSEAFRAFEQRYGDKVPVVRGDWTPYWEDGAGSSALETAMNRASSDRLTQAEALWAMLNPVDYPAKTVEDAWRHVLLYSEHTWGAWCSVTDPESQATKDQWEIKRSYAREADKQSRQLLKTVLESASGAGTRLDGNATDPNRVTATPQLGSDTLPADSHPEKSATDKSRSSATSGAAMAGSQIDVLNTTSWLRTELAVLPKELSLAGDRVLDDQGRPVSSQRLSSGELAFVAREIPAFGARRFALSSGAAHSEASATARGATLDNGVLRVRVDEQTGAIVELNARGIEGNLADTASGHALNDYLFLAGDKLADIQRNGPVKIIVKERGPLVASLLIESSAPGCSKLAREVRVIAGFDHVELINTIDKQRAPASAKYPDGAFAQKGGKESVNFAFPFNVRDGVMRLDIPLGVMRPEIDQMPSACKNWFTVGRWADVSNDDYGVTWITLDAPLVQIGGITATMLGSQGNPDAWRKHVEPTRKLYSWAMNNHWHTNYRAYQDGPTVFRFALRPHRKFASDEATRFATGLSQPLIAGPATEKAIPSPRLNVEPAGVIVTGLKPSDDGKAWIVRLFGASGTTQQAKITWADPAPRSLALSDTSEKPGTRVAGAVTVPGYGLVTLRAERQ